MTGGLWCESDVRERICAAVLRDPTGKSAKLVEPACEK